MEDETSGNPWSQSPSLDELDELDVDDDENDESEKKKENPWQTEPSVMEQQDFQQREQQQQQHQHQHQQQQQSSPLSPRNNPSSPMSTPSLSHSTATDSTYSTYSSKKRRVKKDKAGHDVIILPSGKKVRRVKKSESKKAKKDRSMDMIEESVGNVRESPSDEVDEYLNEKGLGVVRMVKERLAQEDEEGSLAERERDLRRTPSPSDDELDIETDRERNNNNIDIDMNIDVNAPLPPTPSISEEEQLPTPPMTHNNIKNHDKDTSETSNEQVSSPSISPTLLKATTAAIDNISPKQIIETPPTLDEIQRLKNNPQRFNPFDEMDSKEPLPPTVEPPFSIVIVESQGDKDKEENKREEDGYETKSDVGSDFSGKRSEGVTSYTPSQTGPLWLEAEKIATTEEVAYEHESELHNPKTTPPSSPHKPPITTPLKHPHHHHHPSVTQETLEEQMEQRSAIRKKKAQISQSLLARTRSRADVDSLLVPTKGVQVVKGPNSTIYRQMEEGVDGNISLGIGHGHDRLATSNRRQINLHTKDESSIMMTPKLARKRTKVVQLLVFGLLGIVGGFFGSIFTISTCNFASADVEVGGNNNLFRLHFGMWKYSPIDSVFQGYSYCYKYDDEYTDDAPTIARISALIALVFGSIGLVVLWTYLILGLTREVFWKLAVKLFVAAAFCQSFTFLFFKGDICQRNSCTLGPGAFISLVTTLVWIVVAYEMHHNAPLSAMLPEIRQNHHLSHPHRSNGGDNMELHDIYYTNHLTPTTFWNVWPFSQGSSSRGSIQNHDSSTNKMPSLFNIAQRGQVEHDNNTMRRDFVNRSNFDSDGEGSTSSYCPPSVVTSSVVV